MKRNAESQSRRSASPVARTRAAPVASLETAFEDVCGIAIRNSRIAAEFAAATKRR